MKEKIKKKTSLPLTVAVTGSAGSGKTTVCERFIELGLEVINADQVAREVVMPGSICLKKIAARFGESVIGPDGGLNRSELRSRIISDDKERKALEAIIHPEILSTMDDKINAAGAAGSAIVIVEVPLLFEIGMAEHFDVVVLVTADRQAKVGRLMTRDNVSQSNAESLLNIQLADYEKEHLSDIVIENRGTQDDLIKKVDQLHELFYQEVRVVGKST
jgi:dephospho-CoA kinase